MHATFHVTINYTSQLLETSLQKNEGSGTHSWFSGHSFQSWQCLLVQVSDKRFRGLLCSKLSFQPHMLYSLKRILTQLSCVFPRLSSSKASSYAETMSSMMGGSILSNTCHWAAFLGNVGTERLSTRCISFYCDLPNLKLLTPIITQKVRD